MTAWLAGEWGPVLVTAFAAIIVAVAGGMATRTDAWYFALRVPAWKPPDWAFGPIWTVIIVLTATSAVLAWNADPDPAARARLVAAFTVNSVLNIAWSWIFFRLRRPDWALAEVGLLWLSIVALALTVGQASLVAGLLNLPYLAWVSVAACLNFTIVRLNPPARGA
ncbi:TspO protein [Methylobacterium sp. Leaf456]|uniref:TspO/MBR family protein n=1 Tax=Methylobacterium sp. Leaf456 TaxID=1736382 RepID=UPI0006F82173|nr:TspO/MBR family protein [Methylobacterium sp. Leaf456]KQT45596.1 TspO protein [Methylobacterium sp. Leaf456]